MDRQSFLSILAPVISLLLMSCGGSSSTPDPTSSSTTYPQVAGRYALNTGSISYTCSDGSSGSGSPIALNMRVYQNNNALTLENLTIGGGGVPGITVYSSNDATGNVQSNGSFIISQIISANISGVGDVSLTYSWTGSFSNSGWSGSYGYVANILSGGSCRYTSTFSGSYLGSKAVTKELDHDTSVVFVETFNSEDLIGITGAWY